MLFALFLLLSLALALACLYLSFKPTNERYLPAIQSFPRNLQCPFRVVVSFSTIPARLAFVPQVFERLACQTFTPNAIYACIPYISKRTGTPYTIPSGWTLPPNGQIVRCADMGPATKLLGGVHLEDDPDTLIITMDDDHLYDKDTILKRIVYSLKYPNACISNHAHSGLNTSLHCRSSKENAVSPFVDYLEGFGCVSYRRKFITQDMMDFFHQLDPSSDCFVSDDITLSTWMKMNNALLIKLCEPDKRIDLGVGTIQPLWRENRLKVYRNCYKEMERLQFVRTFIWSKANYHVADHVFRPRMAPSAPIGAGDIVCLSTDHLWLFLTKVFSSLQVPIVLVTTDSVKTIPNDIWVSAHSSPSFADILADSRLLHWYAQNYVGAPHPKITPLPVGLDYHTRHQQAHDHPYHQEQILKQIQQEAKPLSERPNVAYGNFQFNHSSARYEDRCALYNHLKRQKGIHFEPKRLSQYNCWKRMSDFSFVLSPHGVGLDCHRTWEALLLGCIVVVKSSPLDALFQSLPVVIVRDWSEITEENLARWKQHLLAQSFAVERLTTAYWQHQMASHRARMSEIR